MNKKQLGSFGESHAEKFLAGQGYHIIKTNYHSRYGEIDVIAVHKNKIIFIEVKTRTTDTFGTPEDAITRSKRQHLIKTALHFLNSTNKKTPFSWRIDLIAVKLDNEYRLKEIKHYKNILDGA